MLRIIMCGLCMLSLHIESIEAQPFTFSSLRPVSLHELEYGEVIFADLNRDGVLDLVGTGNSENTPPFVPHSYVALSGEPYLFTDGSEGLVFRENALGQGLWQSSMVLTDFNRDGLFDIIVSGRIHNSADFETRPLRGVAHLYRGDPSVSFTSISSNLRGVYGGKVRTADIDGDGDEDLLVTGLSSQDEVVTTVYKNEDGRYEPIDFSFTPLAMGDIEWADIDNDGDQDLALSGVTSSGVFRTELYRNNGEGVFTEFAKSLPGLAYSAMDWGDYDGDGDLDLALSGGHYHATKYFEPVVQVWRNENGNLSHTGIELNSVMHGDVAWGDYDSDGHLDLLVVGRTDSGSGRSGYVYRNEGNTLKPRIALPGVAAASAIWGDYDGDFDLDIVIAGSSSGTNPLMRIYRNDSRALNMPPTAPTGLQAREDDGVVTLEWQAAADQETVMASLSYNLRIGTLPGQENVMVAYSDPSTGQRLRSGRGNAGLQTSWRLHSLSAGTYFWSVQAIDQSFIASPWSEEGRFTVTGGGKSTGVEEPVPLSTSLSSGYPNPFQDAITIPFTVKDQSSVEFLIYNILGGLVKRLTRNSLSPGTHHLHWSGKDEQGMPVAPGLYLVRMNAGTVQHATHVMLTR